MKLLRIRMEDEDYDKFADLMPSSYERANFLRSLIKMVLLMGPLPTLVDQVELILKAYVEDGQEGGEEDDDGTPD